MKAEIGQASPNLLLKIQMADRGFSKNRLARAALTDERTIQRWLDGQAHPQADNARRVADALSCEPGDLWPDRFSAKALDFTGTVPVTLFASRAHIPVSLWHESFTQAKDAIDICVYGGTFLFDTIPGFSKMMVDATQRGVRIRFIAGDPNSENVKQRGEDEQVGSSLPSRCALTLDRLRPIATSEGLEVRTHGTTLYASIFRMDDVVIANHHIYGSPASDNPALRITRSETPQLWDSYADSFDLIWAGSEPVDYRKAKS